jgi:hypothetical protein
LRMSCAGPEFVGLASYAEERASTTSGVLSRYWREVGEEILANAIRLAPPARSRSALLSIPAEWLRNCLGAAHLALTELIHGVSVAQPILSSRAHAHEVIARGTLDAQTRLRAFVVDKEHPTGEDVSNMIRREGDRWSFHDWLVEPGDDAVLVIVGGVHDTDVQLSLEDLLTRVDAAQVVDAAPLTGAR